MTDQERSLLTACLKGEKAAWDAFVLQYSALVYHTIKKTLALYHVPPEDDRVEDLFQEFFLAILRDDFKKLRQFRGEYGCTLASWIEIKKLYSGSNVLLGKQATKLKAKDLASGYDILHFAAHAELKGEDPLSSAILLAKSGGDEGRLQVREVFEMELNANLVVLSGCETGLGKLSSGDEFVGLTRAFIYAGTPSVVASLWKVNDASTAHLMSSFYRNLKTKSKVESLRQAQLEMIRGKVSGELLAQRGVGGVGKLGQVSTAPSLSQTALPLSHPYFWAPFILVGDGK